MKVPQAARARPPVSSFLQYVKVGIPSEQIRNTRLFVVPKEVRTWVHTSGESLILIYMPHARRGSSLLLLVLAAQHGHAAVEQSQRHEPEATALLQPIDNGATPSKPGSATHDHRPARQYSFHASCKHARRTHAAPRSLLLWLVDRTKQALWAHATALNTDVSGPNFFWKNTLA